MVSLLNSVCWFSLQEVLKLLLAHGASATEAAADDMGPIHFAAQKGHTEAVRHLINAGK
jgi:ankyrin repeat protein